MDNKEYPRRQFINRCFASATMFLGGSLIFARCGSNNPVKEEKTQAKSGQPCDDLSDVSAQELEKRQKFGYVNKSPDPDHFCDNCGLHIPPSDKGCGGCMLFKGPVHPDGYCIQYVAKG
jgi:hypothetical protein